MRKLYSILTAVLFTLSLVAQTPTKMSYQAVIRNASGVLVQNSYIGIRVSILQGSVTGIEVYKEIFNPNPQTNVNGLITIDIGGGIPLTGTFSTIDWANGPYFIKTETDPTGGTSYSIVGTSEFLSVPYALFSAKSTPGPGTFTHFTGELYQGGIVIKVWKLNGIEKGLIASLVDISTSAAWSNVSTTLIGLIAGGPRDGQANTMAIIGQAGHTSSAASLCDAYISGGYNDWYLPAAWELNQCYDAATIVNEVLGDTNGFQFTDYWSSTEGGNSSARLIYFVHGIMNILTKSYQCRVRAVRRF